MRVIPFSYFNEVPSAVVPEPTFPTLTGTLFDYWRSDKGVTESGGQVTQWDGEVNAEQLVYVNSTGPTVSGSNAGFNNVQTLTLNGVDQGIGNIFSNIGGVNTGDVYMSIYAAPHGDGGDWGEIFGFTSPSYPLNNTADFSEAVMRATSPTQIEMYSWPTGKYTQSDDDTYGKGIYTLASGLTVGRRFYNKGTTVNADGGLYSSYKTNRQGFTIGVYNFNNASLFGKVDIAGAVIWSNPTDFAADITAIETYFQAIFG